MNPNAMAFSLCAGNPTQRIRMDLTPGGQQAPPAQGFGAVTEQTVDVPSCDFNKIYAMIAALNARTLSGADAAIQVSLQATGNAPASPTLFFSHLNASAAPAPIPESPIAATSEQEANPHVPLHQAGIPDSLQTVSVMDAFAASFSPDGCDGSGNLELGGNSSDQGQDIAILPLIVSQGIESVPTIPSVMPALFTAPVNKDVTDAATIMELVQPGSGKQSVPAEVAQTAFRLISQALTEISGALQRIMGSGFEGASLPNASGEAMKTLSEICFVLKAFAGELETSAAQSRKVAIKTYMIDPAQALEMAEFVRLRIVRIETGMSMLGGNSPGEGNPALKPELSFGGISSKAIDLENVAARGIVLGKPFEPSLSEPARDIASMLRTIRDLLAKFGQAGGAQGQAKTGIAARNGSVHETIRGAQAGVVSPSDVQPVLRSLKREAASPAAAQVTEAASQTDRPDSLLNASKIAAKIAAPATIDAVTELIAPGDAGGKIAATHLFAGSEAKMAAPAYRTLDETVMSRITERLHTALRSGINEIRIQLRPESLGEVNIRIRVDGDVVFARIQVESQQVKQIVENGMQLLKDSLSQQHLQTGSLDVNVGGQAWERKTEGQTQQMPDHAGMAAFGKEHPGDAVETETSEPRMGFETGRRFGGNTIEYFA